MGMYLNPGKAAFEEAVNSEIYIDKTQMIGYLNSVVKTKQKYLRVFTAKKIRKNHYRRYDLRVLWQGCR